ncbi:DNA-binding transcriptional regulator, AcrR family [Nonomuraea solani]|uniref:DNA-binding transcriptional regulator, AcrR family n=1 Tax=Nonomuraea solani TaxID=1144553 RepID=A0A1H6E3P0_9ACTN|nr:TetR/AcrR family transcriptional regulator [Nonomuraea solani]SEG91626.1 DNA-binding transcriptional regulator, AcrR family [Nonomuraea solani]
MHSPEERESILRSATSLFSALGYDGTDLAQIAEAAGVDTAAVGACFTDKRHLYLEVMGLAHRLLADVIEARSAELAAAPPEGRAEALHRFIDGYIDLCVDHPEVPALWMHRWLSDASDIADPDSDNAQPLTQAAVDAVSTLAEPIGADALYTTYTMVWCIQGFSLSGVLNGTGTRRGPEDRQHLRRFRAHMHQLLGRELGLEVPGGP